MPTRISLRLMGAANGKKASLPIGATMADLLALATTKLALPQPAKRVFDASGDELDDDEDVALVTTDNVLYVSCGEDFRQIVAESAEADQQPGSEYGVAGGRGAADMADALDAELHGQLGNYWTASPQTPKRKQRVEYTFGDEEEEEEYSSDVTYERSAVKALPTHQHSARRSGPSHDKSMHWVVESVEVCENDDTLDDVEAVVVTASPVRRRKRVGECLTAAEARAQAARERLAFVTSSASATGFHGVTVDPRRPNFPYDAHAGVKTKGSFLGSFASAEEAALAVARHMGNTTERRVQVGHAQASRGALAKGRSYTVICRRDGCGALVDLSAAKDAARGRDRFAFGDGCGSQKCSKSHDWRYKRFAAAQRESAQRLLDGRRQLMAWPMSSQKGRNGSNAERYDALFTSRAETQAVAVEVLARYES